jgi:hypothetical protein
MCNIPPLEIPPFWGRIFVRFLLNKYEPSPGAVFLSYFLQFIVNESAENLPTVQHLLSFIHPELSTRKCILSADAIKSIYQETDEGGRIQRTLID